MILDSLGKKGAKNQKIYEANSETTFYITNVTDSYNTHLEESTMLPYKATRKH